MHRGIFRYDLPRQALIAFLGALALTAAVGWMISVLDQVDPEDIDRAGIRGAREGRMDGYEVAFERGRLDGSSSAARELDQLLASGDPDVAYNEAYNFAWNEALDTALERAKRNKIEVESAFDEWEALRR